MTLDKEATESKEELNQAVPPVDHETAEEQPDYSSFSKKELSDYVEKLLKETDIKKIEVALKPIRLAFDELKEQEKSNALQKFLAEGGIEGDFELKPDEASIQFEQAYKLLREKKHKHTQDLEKLKDQNLKRKKELLEKLRTLVDGEESHDSFQLFKQIQTEWKSIGLLPAGASKELWASYESLVDRYLSNRSIFLELKELDKKKNMQLKNEICEKAEKLAEKEISGIVMKDLNDLHEEYKHIGPAPKEAQEVLWQRFKAASDKIYEKRRQQLDGMKTEWEENYKKKIQIIEEVEKYSSFTTDKIGEWNEKTQELLALQKNWDSTGVIAKEKAKDVSKRFWAAFKQFFFNKGEFFRKLEDFREKNLQEKIKLCEEAEALMASEEFEHTAEKVKTLQKRWKEVGPVPEKQRNAIFDRFKVACDTFFDRKRGKNKEVEGSYEDNLKKKIVICEELEKSVSDKSGDLVFLKKLQAEFNNIGFVPKKDMAIIRKRFSDAVDKFIENIPSGKEDKANLKLSLEVEKAHTDPQALKNVQKQEGTLRKKLTQLENDVAVWRNNMEFFARSKNAEHVRKEFTEKIEVAEKEIKAIKNQLSILYKG